MKNEERKCLFVAMVGLSASLSIWHHGCDSGDGGSGGEVDTETDTDTGTETATETGTEEGEECAEGEGWYDPSTGLCWQDPPISEKVQWYYADAYCLYLDLGGRHDWRLPDIGELISLMRGCVEGEATGDLSKSACGVEDPWCLESSCNDGADCGACTCEAGPGEGCYWDPALSGDCTWYWSSSSYVNDPGRAWRVGFHCGHVYSFQKSLEYEMRVRCVRGGT